MASNSSLVKTLCESKLYSNDTVFKFDKNGRIKFGLVAESNDDYDDFDDDDSEIELNDSIQLGSGEICVAWYPDGIDEVIEKENVQLAYRSISPNDYVRRISLGNDSQKGYCIEAILKADVQIKGKPVVIKNVASSRLHRLIEKSDWVSLDSWIGIAHKIQLKLLLKTNCGALVEIISGSDGLIYKFRDPDDTHRNDIFSSNTFYAGRKLIGFINSVKNGKWITPKPTFRRGQKISFVVESVLLDSVWVEWKIKKENTENGCCSNVMGDNLKRLKRLDPHQQFDRQIGDMHFLKVTEDDLMNLVSKAEWRKQRTSNYKNQKILRDFKTEDENKEIIQIAESTTICEALNYNSRSGEDDYDDWQTDDDGWETDDDELPHYFASSSNSNTSPSQENKLKLIKKSTTKNVHSNPPKVGNEISVEIILIRSEVTVAWEDGTIESGISSTHLYTVELDENEVFPRNYVVADNECNEFSSRNYGVVQKVNKNERTAIVKWFRTYAMTDIPDNSEPQFLNETEASLYDLKAHPDFNFELHSRVTLFTGISDDDKITTGHVIHIDTDGRIKVEWIDGNYGICWPQELITMGKSRYCSYSSLNSSGYIENDEREIESESNLLKKVMVQFEDFSNKLKGINNAIVSLKVSLKHGYTDCEELVQRFLEITKRCSFIDRLMNTSFFYFELKTSNNSESPTKSLNLNSTEPSSVENSLSIELIQKHHSSSYQELNKSHDSGNDSKIEIENCNGSTGDLTIKIVGDLYLIGTELCDLLTINITKAVDEMNKRVSVSTSSVIEFNSSEKMEVAENKIHNSKDATDVTHDVTNVALITLENAPTSHKFISTVVCPTDFKHFHRAVKFDHQILLTSLPPDVWVKVYEDRMDLLSVAIIGAKGTPYEDGIFLFDFQLTSDYPRSPPLCHYVSLCSTRLNPNLYVDGKVCVSLLGTWSGDGSELWGPGCTLLQVIVSIQGLILNSEPYFNEAGFDKQKDTEKGQKESELYNEIVVLKLVESMTKLMANPPEVFREEIIEHFYHRGDSMYQRIAGWMDKSNQTEFSLAPSRGFCLKLADLLVHFRKKLDSIIQE